MTGPDRLTQIFLDLLAFNSPPGEEAAVSRFCAELLRDAGFTTQHDAAGNLIGRRAGRLTHAPRLFFSAHLDTVAPTAGMRVELMDGSFRAHGSPILGADDKAGAAAILDALLELHENDCETGDLIAVLSTREEIGLRGARELDPAHLAGYTGFVLDAGGPTGTIIDSAPAQNTIRARITGRAAHAGVEPERGVSALQIACRAVNRMPLGRIDAETTANCGTLHGGTASNVVAESAELLLEARSRSASRLESQTAEMTASLREAAEQFGGSVALTVEKEYSAYRWNREAWPIRLADAAWRGITGAPAGYRPQGGGSDASIFNAAGIGSVVLTTGYVRKHTPEESIPLVDLQRAAAWVRAIITTAAAGDWPAELARPEVC